MPEDLVEEFGAAVLGDTRRTRRLGRLANSLSRSPEASIAACCGGWADTMGAYRLLNSEEFEPAALIAPHQGATIERCRGRRAVVAAQDTTELDFSRMKEAEGLGPLNDEGRRGFYLHSLYVLDEDGLPLGLLGTTILNREESSFRGAATRKKRSIEHKESRRWLEGYLKTNELARELPDCEVFSVSDREGDIYELYEAWHEIEDGPRAEWIIRANQDRALLGESARLFETLEQAPVLGEIEFEVPARKGTKKVKGNRVATSRSARTVRQRVRALKVTPRPPYRRGRRLAQVTFQAVLAEEIDPPVGEDPVCWLLLTSKEVTSLQEARRILNLYMRRWAIEVFHRVLKTGCRVERIQLKNSRALINALMIYMVIAWRILYFTHLGRECPELPCGSVFEEAEWKSACAVVRRDKEAGEPSLSEFIAILGKLGGHLGRTSDGPPGPQSIWRGLTRVRDFACAWQAFHEK